MDRLTAVLILFTCLSGCERNREDLNSYITARIVGFDLNCSTCILEFPDDYQQVKEVIGQSPDNYYHAVNLNKLEYEIGQQLKVKIRSPYTDELRQCIAMYPSYNYKGIYVTDTENFDNMVHGDTASLSWHDCLKGPENNMYICLESVINDSRCPTGAYCFWEGNAIVRFKFEKFNDEPVLFDLNTHGGFTTDTIISGYKFSLVGLYPYPALSRRIDQKDYKAQLVIEKE